MIDLEDPQRWIGISICEGVEPCSENDVLGKSPFDRRAELIFRQATPGGESSTQERRQRRRFVLPGVDLEPGCHGRLDDGECERVLENDGDIDKLVRGTAFSDPLGGSASTAVRKRIQCAATLSVG